jgi:hypothetical protein
MTELHSVSMPEFQPWPKMARLSRECVITEKIDGTNAQVCITEDGQIFAGSRTRWITPTNDNYGFARWVEGNKAELLKLGPGRHFGEWWGAGIQRRYGLTEKRFSLFNALRWTPDCEARNVDEWGKWVHRVIDRDGNRCDCVEVVPVLYRGPFDTTAINQALSSLQLVGSVAAPGFPKPEGIVVFHVAAGIGFKKTIEGDEQPKCLLDPNKFTGHE